METQNNHRQPPSSSAITFHHHHQHSDIQHFPIQYMFEKPLTPSDVGKLNRLVIPKQHAENYFPLANQQSGVLLSFEDESGKLWRFRYSYWNSSQSYVLTKGWSRYVKEKRLDAGDVVLFQRHLLDCDRMFIGWRRRAAAVVAAHPFAGGVDAQNNYPSHHLPQALHTGEIHENADTYERGVVATRRLRLFGVNLECPDDLEPSTPYGSSQGGQSSDHQCNFRVNNSHHDMIPSDE